MALVREPFWKILPLKAREGEADTGHDDMRSRPLNERSSRYLTWESLTAVRPRVAPGEAQAKESR